MIGTVCDSDKYRVLWLLLAVHVQILLSTYMFIIWRCNTACTAVPVIEHNHGFFSMLPRCELRACCDRFKGRLKGRGRRNVQGAR